MRVLPAGPRMACRAWELGTGPVSRLGEATLLASEYVSFRAIVVRNESEVADMLREVARPPPSFGRKCSNRICRVTSRTRTFQSPNVFRARS
jgi:hypothetical protein